MTSGMRVISSVSTMLVLLLGATASEAQAPLPSEPPLLANPSAVEFTVDGAQPSTAAFRVEFFRSDEDPATAEPVGAVDTQSATFSGGIVRIELRDALDGMADGVYVAVLRTLVSGTVSSAAATTTPFVVYGHSPAGPNRGATTVAALPPEPERNAERFWTKVAIAIGAGLLLMPMFFQ